MADTINVPGMGATKKTTVYVAGGIGAVIIGVVWYRSRGAATDTTAATTSEIDPATGYPYGSAEDDAALQAQAAYQSSGNLGGSSDAYTGGQQPAGFVNNQAWKQAADDYLTNVVGLDGPAVSTALGKYLTGGDVVAGGEEDSYIRQAIASQGYPPVNGADGYPPSIHHTATAPGSKVLSAPAAGATPTHTATTAVITWPLVAHATTYHVRNTKGGWARETSGSRLSVPRHATYTVTASGPGYTTSSPSRAVTV